MSFYTGSSYQLNLPRTPDAFSNVVNMNSVNGSSIRADFLHGFKGWRSSSSNSVATSQTMQKSVEAPLTPPMSTSFQARTTTGNPYSSFPHQHPSGLLTVETGSSSRPSTSSGSSMTLPPIAHLERHLSHLPPLTPPEDIPSSQSSRLPLPVHLPLPQALPVPLPRISTVNDEYYLNSNPPSSGSSSKPLAVMPPSQLQQHSTVIEVQLPPPPPAAVVPPPPESQSQPQPAVQPVTQDSAPSYAVDWLDFTRTRSAQFIAEKTCEMICYLWFAAPAPLSKSGSAASSPAGSPSTSPSISTLMPTPPSSSPPSTAPPSTLQLVATPPFVQFMQKLLETTQVSQSVIVLSLHYIYRLKEKNSWTPAQSGSEFRIAVAALMMGNKFLDDNTYTNKTWSEVSGIELDEINRMEREFLLGVDFNLYVDKVTYESWLNLLKGLVLAKERDCRKWAGGRGSRVEREKRKRVAAIPPAPSSVHAPHHVYAPSPQGPARTYSLNVNAPSMQPAPAVVAPATVARSTAKAYSYKSHHGHRARSTSPTVRTSSVPAPSARPAAVYVSYTAPPAATVPVSTYASASLTTQQQSTPAYPAPAAATSSYVYAPSSISSTSTATATTTTSTYQAPLPTQSSHTSYTYPAPSYPSGTNSAYSSPAPCASVPTGAKRSAEAAFSPTSATFTHIPSKRPVSMHGGMGISLRIPETQIGGAGASANSSASGGASASPLDGLQSFERMSLGGGGGGPGSATASPVQSLKPPKKEKRGRGKSYSSSSKSSVVPQTLSTAYDYSVNDDRRSQPQHLYFYALACSPVKHDYDSPADENQQPRRLDQDGDQAMSPTEMARERRASSSRVHQEEEKYVNDHGQRKGRLRYHQPAPPSGMPYAYADLNAGAVTNERMYAPVSAAPATDYSSAKSHQKHPKSGTLPNFRDDVWARPPAPPSSYGYHHTQPRSARQDEDDDMSGGVTYAESPLAQRSIVSAAPTHSANSSISSTSTITPGSPSPPTLSSRPPVPSAPFANAGPPGVNMRFYEGSGTPYAHYAPSYAGYHHHSHPHPQHQPQYTTYAPSSTATTSYTQSPVYTSGYSPPSSAEAGYPTTASSTAAPTSSGYTYEYSSQSQYSSPVTHTHGNGYSPQDHGYHRGGYASVYSSPQRGYGYATRRGS